MEEKIFNLNQSVKVKLKPLGVIILKDRRDELNARIDSRGGTGFVPFELKVDDEGYTSFQMWNLMEIFGDYMGLCKETPFELDIKISI